MVDNVGMEKDVKNDTDKSYPPRMAHDISLETAKIMFHGTNQEKTSAEVADKLAKYFAEAWNSLPIRNMND